VYMRLHYSCKRLARGLVFGPFSQHARSYGPCAQVPRRLGAGGALTVLQFAPLARLCPVLGFYALNGVCAGFTRQGCILANQFQKA
jgi:hypothetical protein